ncbi:MAG: cation:proton antiporter [Lentihominibacter sp.]
MNLDSLITDLALLLIVAGIVTLIFKKLKQPVVLGYIVAGFLISPNFEYMPTIVDQADITVWAEMGVIFLMFGLGLEFSFKKIATVGGSAFTVAVTVMAAMIIIGAGVGDLMGWGKMDCIFLGGMISMSSTMIILKSYEEYNLKKEKFTQLILSALILEDIAGIFMMVVLSTLSVGQGGSGLEMAGKISIMLMYLVIWLIISIYLVPSFLKKVAPLMNDEIIVIIMMGFCLGMVIIANYIGFSSALGAFLAGSVVAGTVQVVRIENLIKPIKDLFGAIFFVSVGMKIVPALLIEYIVPILILTVVVIFGQLTFATIGILLSGQTLHTAVRGGFSMVQIGEFSFIIATLGLSLGVISDFLYPIIVCVSVITAFMTPVFIKNAEKVYVLLERKLPAKTKIFLRKNTSEQQSKNTKDADWNEYIKKVAQRTLICSVMLFVIYWTGFKFLAPAMPGLISSEHVRNAVTAAIILAAMIPFMNFMHGTNNALFVKLWIKHRANRLPLLTVKAIKILIAACFMALVLRTIFNIPFIILVFVSAIPIYFIIRSSWLNGVTIGMESKFIANFSERILDKQKRERGHKDDYRWLNESMYIVEFEIVDPEFEMTISDFTSRREFFVTIVRIIRNGKFINMPEADEVVKYGDKLHMLGSWDEVDGCTIFLEKAEYIEYTDTEDMILKDYIYGQIFHGVPEKEQLVCVPIKLESGSELIRKSIKNSDIRNRFSGTVIGIERGDLPVVNPDTDTVLRKGDMIWLMGGNNMVDKLIQGGLMDE